MSQTVVGLFDSPAHAQAAVNELASNGIPRERVSIVAREGTDTVTTSGTGEKTEAAKGAGIGAGVGAAAGAGAGILAVLGMIAIPGIGGLLALGPIVTTLTGAAAGAAAGGLVGGLVGLGIPDDDAEAYDEGVRRGGTLVTVQTEDAMVERAADILEKHGAVDIDRKAVEWQAAGWKTKYDRSARTTDTTARDTAANIAGAATRSTDRAADRARETSQTGEKRIPVVEEQLHVSKRQVRGGGVRVYSHSTERPVQEDVTLRQESVRVDRRPADRPASDADMRAFKEGSIEMTESREEAVVDKTARVTGEVVVRKDVEDRKETVRDTVRKTDVKVDRTGAGNAGNASSPNAGNQANQANRDKPACDI